MSQITPIRRQPIVTRRALVGGGAALATATALGLPARAQEKFPSKPIEVVTHAGVGGGTDITARMMMVQAPAELGVELVVANRTGGSGAAALAYAASRPRDGHTTLLITHNANIASIGDRVIRFADGAIRGIDVNPSRARPGDLHW